MCVPLKLNILVFCLFTFKKIVLTMIFFTRQLCQNYCDLFKLVKCNLMIANRYRAHFTFDASTKKTKRERGVFGIRIATWMLLGSLRYHVILV